MENISKSTQVAQQLKILLEKSHQMKEEKNRKLHVVLTGLVEEKWKTAIEQIQDLMKDECFTKKTNKIVQATRPRKKNESVPVQKRLIKGKFEDE